MVFNEESGLTYRGVGTRVHLSPQKRWKYINNWKDLQKKTAAEPWWRPQLFVLSEEKIAYQVGSHLRGGAGWRNVSTTLGSLLISRDCIDGGRQERLAGEKLKKGSSNEFRKARWRISRPRAGTSTTSPQPEAHPRVEAGGESWMLNLTPVLILGGPGASSCYGDQAEIRP